MPRFNITLTIPLLRCTVILLLLLAGHAHASSITETYKLSKKLSLEGPTHWDLLTLHSEDHRLYITRGDRVDVMDVTTNKIIGSLTHLAGVHGVALASDIGKGFITNGESNTVTIFDLNTLTNLQNVPAGNKPDAIVYDPVTHCVFAANGKSNDVTVIDAVKGFEMATIKLEGQPEFAVVDEKGLLYINIEDKSHLVVIDTQKLKIVGDYNLAPNCDSPTGLAIDRTKNRLFSACSNKTMVIVQGETGKIIETLPIGAHSDAAVYDPQSNLVFSSNGDGTLTIISASSPDHYTVLQTVTTVPSARTMALDPATHNIYLAAAELDGIDPATQDTPHPRPKMKANSFTILVVAPSTP